jgi:hypothetical protein
VKVRPLTAWNPAAEAASYFHQMVSNPDCGAYMSTILAEKRLADESSFVVNRVLLGWHCVSFAGKE